MFSKFWRNHGNSYIHTHICTHTIANRFSLTWKVTLLDSWGYQWRPKKCVWAFFNGNTVSVQMFALSSFNKWNSTLINVMTQGSFSCFPWQTKKQSWVLLPLCIRAGVCSSTVMLEYIGEPVLCVSEQFEYLCACSPLFPPLQHLHRCCAGCHHYNSPHNDWASRRPVKGFPSPLWSSGRGSPRKQHLSTFDLHVSGIKHASINRGKWADLVSCSVFFDSEVWKFIRFIWLLWFLFFILSFVFLYSIFLMSPVFWVTTLK